MNRFSFIPVAFAIPAVFPVAASAQHNYAIEMSHSTIGFSIDFLYSPVRGQFDRYKGAIVWDPANATKSSARISIEANSIHTGSEHRDEHLKSSDFLDVARYPLLTFETTSVSRAGDGFIATGPLTLHGVTRTVSIRFKPLRAPVVDTMHNMTIVNFHGTTKLSRKDFGITGGSAFNPWFDDIRQRAMADTIEITLDVQGWRNTKPR